MRLNLGCGNVIFPVSKEATPWHIKTAPEEVHDGEWMNVDKYGNKGVDQITDLFRYPLPFKDNSADFIYCSHLVEHIPHAVTLLDEFDVPVNEKYDYMSRHLDGWFVFFYECWRILKPNAEIYIASPFAFSNAAFSDPTHTRYITPATFGYLCEPEANTPFDYHLPMRFEFVEPPVFRFFGKWAEAVKAGKVSAEQATEIAMTRFNSCDELRVRMRAIK